MEPHRSSYPDEPEPRWSSAERYGQPEWDPDPRFDDRPAGFADHGGGFADHGGGFADHGGGFGDRGGNGDLWSPEPPHAAPAQSGPVLPPPDPAYLPPPTVPLGSPAVPVGPPGAPMGGPPVPTGSPIAPNDPYGPPFSPIPPAGSPVAPPGYPGAAGPGAMGSSMAPRGPMGPRSGQPLPPLPGDLPPRQSSGYRDGPAPQFPDDPTSTRETPAVQAARYHAEPIDRAALRRPTGPSGPSGSSGPKQAVPEGIYRARRPALAAAVGVIAAGAAIPVLITLKRAIDAHAAAGGVIAAVLVLMALPLGAVGLYGLGTGAARLPDAPPAHAWLRPPLAYLVVALVLFLAAGLAAR